MTYKNIANYSNLNKHFVNKNLQKINVHAYSNPSMTTNVTNPLTNNSY